MMTWKKLCLAASIVLVKTFIISTHAAADEKLTVYSYRDPWTVQPLFDLFEQQTGIKVKVELVKDDLIQQLEGDQLAAAADVIFTVDIGRLDEIKQAGLTQPLANQQLEEQIPAQYRDPEGHWFGLTKRARVIYASKDRVPAGSIQSYLELSDPKWRGRICTRSGHHFYSVAFLARMIAVYGEEEAENWLIGLRQNLAYRPQGNDRFQVQSIYEGSCDLSLGNSYYLGKMFQDPTQIEWARAVYPIFPDQDSVGTAVNISGMAMAKFAPNPANAERFMEFLATDLAQQIYAEQNFEYPISAGIPWSGIVSSWGSFLVDQSPQSELAKLRAKAAELTARVGFDL